MFYCDECANNSEKLFKTFHKSYGICEICGQVALCNNDSD